MLAEKEVQGGQASPVPAPTGFGDLPVRESGHWGSACWVLPLGPEDCSAALAESLVWHGCPTWLLYPKYVPRQPSKCSVSVRLYLPAGNPGVTNPAHQACTQ